MADITFVTAKIGGGKSLFATRVICNELATTERLISTSIPLFLDDHWMTVKRTKGLKYPAGIPSWWESPYSVQDVDDSGCPMDSKEMRIFVPGLATWCHYEIKKVVDLNKRLRILQHEEIPKFYLHLPNRDLTEENEILPGRKQIGRAHV